MADDNIGRDKFSFQLDEDGAVSVESAVFQALGAASMCWSETPTGVFDSTKAKEIGEALLEKLGPESCPGCEHSSDAHPFVVVNGKRVWICVKQLNTGRPSCYACPQHGQKPTFKTHLIDGTSSWYIDDSVQE